MRSSGKEGFVVWGTNRRGLVSFHFPLYEQLDTAHELSLTDSLTLIL